MRKDEAVGTGQQEKNTSLFTCDLIIFFRVSLYIKTEGVWRTYHFFPSVFETLRCWKLTTHGSQHFHKQNALKAVAFLSTAESPQLRVEPGEAEGRQQETCKNFADTSSCMCKIPVVLISCVTGAFLNFESKYLDGTVSPDFLPIFFFLYPSHLGRVSDPDPYPDPDPH
jgi:hypothetical protein